MHKYLENQLESMRQQIESASLTEADAKKAAAKKAAEKARHARTAKLAKIGLLVLNAKGK